MFLRRFLQFEFQRFVTSKHIRAIVKHFNARSHYKNAYTTFDATSNFRSFAFLHIHSDIIHWYHGPNLGDVIPSEI